MNRWSTYRRQLKNCPNCGLLNPLDALLCECGHSFKEQPVEESVQGQAHQHLKSVMSVLFRFEGRISRLTFWVAMASLIVIWAGLVLFMSTTTMDSPGVIYILLPMLVILSWCTYAVHAKRWHDRDKSGWWSLVGFIPLIGPFWLLIELGCLPGTPARNRYGPRP